MSNTNKQLTAVEWLINEIKEDHPEIIALYENECDQALAMGEEQIKNAVGALLVLDSMNDASRTQFNQAAENYYNSLYGKEEGQ
jgi:hypothetical protein